MTEMKRLTRRDAARQTAPTQALEPALLTLRTVPKPRRRAHRCWERPKRRARHDVEWGTGRTSQRPALL